MNHAPQAGLEGGALQYEAAGDGHYNDGDKPGTLPEMVPKVTDEEELGDETLLDPAEVAKTLPPWYQQITVRALLIGTGLGIFFSIVQQRLGLQSGVAPGFGLASCILGFGAIRFIVIPAMVKLGASSGYYHPQETSIIQTTANSVLDLNWAGGFHSFLVALSGPVMSQFFGQANITASDVYEPLLSRIIPYQVCIAFIGIFVVICLRRALIIDFRLPWPSATAAGVLIKSLHTKKGEQQAKKQLLVLGIALLCAFLWSMFEWFFDGGKNCEGGFGSFPSLGLTAYKNTFYFDWEFTYVAIGILVPHIVNGSMMLGAVLMFGIVLPIAKSHEGVWYPDSSDLSSSKDVRGPYAYQVFGALGIFLGEGAYTIGKVLLVASINTYQTYKSRKQVGAEGTAPVRGMFGRPPVNSVAVETPEAKRLSEYVFQYGRVPWWVGVGGYIIFLIIGTATIPQLYPPAKWYYCLVMYIVAPIFSIINGYCTGMTDWDITSAWSTLGVLIVGAWAGKSSGAVVAALVMSGIAGAAVNAASSVLGDFKTGYYTLVHPRAMLCVQIYGEVIGLVMAPIIFYYLFYQPAISAGKPLGAENSDYAVPQAYVNLAAAIVSTNGISELPRHCFLISGILFFACMALPAMRDFGPRRLSPYIPVPMGMCDLACGASLLVVGAWLAVDMTMGSGVKFLWQYFSPATSMVHMVPLAAGVISGEGLWAVPEAVLALANAQPPICMQFYPAAATPPAAS